MMLLLAAAAACDLPTALPEWDTRWVIPAEHTRLRVADLLPIDLVETADGFEVELPFLSLTRSLGELCPDCAPLHGLTIPKPPFTAEVEGQIPVSEAVVSARIDGGTIQVDLSHDLGFDPLRPGGGEQGYLVLELRSGATILARDSIDGGDTALPAGSVLSRTLVLSAADVSEALDLGFVLHSPAGTPVEIDLNDRISVSVPVSRVAVRDLRLFVDDHVTTEPLVLELDAVDAAVRDRVRSGRMHLEISNPFAITGDLELRITSPAIGIAKPVSVDTGVSEVRVDLSRDEMLSILSQPEVVITLEGPASTSPTGTAVEPGQELGLRLRLELVVASST